MPDILLVEDDVLIAELVAEALEDVGLKVEMTHSSGDAVGRIEAEPRSFAAVVTDINLGERLTGFDVARRARELNPAVKVVYVTGMPENIRSAEEEALMFPKPFSPHELAAQVQILLRRN